MKIPVFSIINCSFKNCEEKREFLNTINNIGYCEKHVPESWRIEADNFLKEYNSPFKRNIY